MAEDIGDKFTSIIFQTKRHAFSSDEQLANTIRTATGRSDIAIQRENHADGTWSTWFSLSPGDADPWELGRKIDGIPGLGGVMLRTNSGKIAPLNPVPPLSTGAIVDRAPPLTTPGLKNDSPSRATHEIGNIERDGDHKGEIHGGIYPADNKPIWFSAAPRLMDHYAAAAWAKEQGGALPTRYQGDYLTTLKGKGGAFTELFNRGGSFPAGYVWLAESGTDDRYEAWCQRLSDGDQDDDVYRGSELPVLCVRR